MNETMKAHWYEGGSCRRRFMTSVSTWTVTVFVIYTRLIVGHYNISQQVTWLASSSSEAQAHVVRVRYVAPHGECYYNTVLSCDYSSSSSVVLRAFSAPYVYSKFGRHPHPLGYLCAKFNFFRDLHCWGSPWRKIAYLMTLTHSPRLSDDFGTLRNNYKMAQ